eukprot:scaffold2.g6977.t1
MSSKPPTAPPVLDLSERTLERKTSLSKKLSNSFKSPKPDTPTFAQHDAAVKPEPAAVEETVAQVAAVKANATGAVAEVAIPVVPKAAEKPAPKVEEAPKAAPAPKPVPAQAPAPATPAVEAALAPKAAAPAPKAAPAVAAPAPKAAPAKRARSGGLFGGTAGRLLVAAAAIAVLALRPGSSKSPKAIEAAPAKTGAKAFIKAVAPAKAAPKKGARRLGL